MEFAENMPANSVERYKLYFISGAVTNILIEWLNESAKEPPRKNDFCFSIINTSSLLEQEYSYQ